MDLPIFCPKWLLAVVIEKILLRFTARTNPMVVSSPLYRRRVFQRVGLFDEALGALEDWDFHFRCVINGIVFQHNGYPPSSRALIRIHDRSMSTDRSYMINDLRRFRQKHKNNYEFALENDLMITDFRKLISCRKNVHSPILYLACKKNSANCVI